MKWYNLKEDGPPENNACVIVSFRGRVHLELAVYQKVDNEFCLDSPSSPHAMFPLDIKYYAYVNHPEWPQHD